MQPSKIALLTGAGFTKNFRGYLGGEMWSAIFSQPLVAGNPRLRKDMLDRMDFEQSYYHVMKGDDFLPGEKELLGKAVEKAYQEMHAMIHGMSRHDKALLKFVLREIVARFAGSGEERGFLFTLNQDLLMETFYHETDPVLGKFKLSIPMMDAQPWVFSQKAPPYVRQREWIRVPDEATVKALHSKFWDSQPEQRFCYVKLHGSYGWRSADGSNAMVIGGEKGHRISSEPILRAYFTIFEDVLRGPDCKLLIIGYGFKDPHINQRIVDAVTNHGLRVYIVSPSQPHEFRKELGLAARSYVGAIWNKGMHGYYRGTLYDFIDMDKLVLSSDGEWFLRKVQTSGYWNRRE
ncbi:MAG: SIR2 family protein [Nitrospira defluvii]|nr:SIR2 family protein [Nitrospira defluvii]